MFVYVYIYILYVRISYMNSALFVRDAIFQLMLYMSKNIAKLAMFESQKEVYMTKLWNTKERKAKA